MSGLDWYPRHSRKALDGMRRLTLEQRGAYNTLLDLIYDRGGPVPDDDRWLAGWMGVSARRWRQLRAELIAEGRIIAFGEGAQATLSDELAEKEIAKQNSRRKTNGESGAKGGQKSAETRRETSENKDLGEANAEPNAQASLKLRELEVEEEIDISETSVSEIAARAAPCVPAADDIAEALSAYNAVAAEAGLPLARTLTAARRKHLKARLAEHGIDGWRAAMDGLRAPFCCGENARGWRANLDFALQAASCAKLTENAYATGARSPPATPGMVAAASDERAFREAIRRAEERDGQSRDNQRDQSVVVALPAPADGGERLSSLAGGLRR